MWSDVNLPLCLVCCLHAAAEVAGGAAVPAASCRIPGAAAAGE